MIRYKLQKSDMTGYVYPQQVDSCSFTVDSLNRKLEERYGPIAPAVMADAIDIISRRLSEGDTVTLRRLGSFSLRLGMRKKAVREFSDVRTHDITVKGIRFNASKCLRDRVARQEIHIRKGDARRRSTTTTDRWVMFYARVLDDHARSASPLSSMTFTVQLYRMYTGCTYYTARKDLALLCGEGKLREVSTRAAKIYMLSGEVVPEC